MQFPIETASFGPHELDALVAASLACPACLSGSVDWTLQNSPHDPWVACRCRECEHERPLYLTPDQALRLALHERRPLDTELVGVAEPA
jgi:hypothetical protein